MANALHFDPGTAGADCYLVKDIAALDTLYSRVEVYFDSAARAAWLAANAGNYISPVFCGSSSSSDASIDGSWFEVVFADGNTGNGQWDDWESSRMPAGAVDPIPDAWHVLEMFVSPTVAYYKVDGIALPWTSFSSTINAFFVGAVISVWGYAPSGDVWVGKVQVGSAEHASDLLNFNPATASDLSAFDAVHGTVTLAAPPVAVTAEATAAGSLHFTAGTSRFGSGEYMELFTGNAASVYVEAEVLFTTASIAAMNADSAESPDIVSVLRGGVENFDIYEATYLWRSSGDIDEWGDWQNGNLTAGSPGTVAPDVWHVVKIFVDVDGSGYYGVDGNQLPFTGVASGPFPAVMIGMPDAPNVGDVWVNRVKVGTTDGGSDILSYDPNTSEVFGHTPLIVSRDGTGLRAFDTPPVAPPGGGVAEPIDVTFGGVRFFEGFEWRYLFTDLTCVPTTWANGLITGRKISRVLNQASTIEGQVRPGDFRVNGIWTDGYPRVAQSNRLVFAFRREGAAGGVGNAWQVREAGILMSPEDEGDPEVALTHFVAYDPWKYLEGRPAMDATGALPGADGFLMPFAGNVTALTFLKNTIANEGGCFIDAGVAWGGTSFYGGTIETTPAINYQVQQGTSTAQVWSDLCDSGTLDIRLKAIYDPVNRPGFTHEVSIFKLAGSKRPNALFAWDRMNRSVSKIDRLHDGTPGAFFNKVQYHAGSGGPPIPATGPLVNVDSVLVYGKVWSTQFFPSQIDTDPIGAAVLGMAKQALVMAKQGQRAMTLYPITERAPVPLLAYDVGDRVPIYASNELRVETNGYERVMAIPIEIDDDGLESIGGLLCTPDYRNSVGAAA